MCDFRVCYDLQVFAFGMLAMCLFDILMALATWLLEKAKTERVNREGEKPSLFSRIFKKLFSKN